MGKEYFKIAIKSLKTRQLRSWLTIAGIVIGVFLIVSLFSLSEGIKNTLLTQMKMMGGDLIIVFPGELSDIVAAMFGGSKLSEDDLKAMEKADGVDLVLFMKYQAELVRHKNRQKTTLVYGLSLEKEELAVFNKQMGWNLKEGRWPVVGRREAVVGSLVPEEIFPNLKIGDEITINAKKLNVVGVLFSVGSKQDDQMTGMDINLYEQITGDKGNGFPMAFATIKSGFEVDEVAENIKEKLEETRKRKRGEDLLPFSVITSEKVVGLTGNIMDIIQIVVVLFGSIGIVVGGIGIMNTMYTSVHERTREIGIMKAIGAKNSTITAIFLIESGIIGLIGGVGGTVLGLVLAKAVELYGQLHPVLYIEASVSPFVVLFGLSFSFFVGCAAGFLPARGASRLKPVDALRYE